MPDDMMGHFNTPSADRVPEHYASVEMMCILQQQQRQRISDHIREKTARANSSRTDDITISMGSTEYVSKGLYCLLERSLSSITTLTKASPESRPSHIDTSKKHEAAICGGYVGLKP
jgi:hypothetical protein